MLAALLVGFAVAFAAGLVFALLFGADSLGTAEVFLLGGLATQVGFLVGALGFLRWKSDPEFLLVRRPTGRELGVGAAALVLAVGAEVGRRLVVRFTTVESAGTVPAMEDPATVTLVGIVAFTVLVAPPVEELLFRGVVQRYVAEASTATIGIAVATVLFVPMHGLQVLTSAPGVPAVAATLTALAVVSISIGAAYARTDTVAIPVGVHVCYNASSLAIGVAVAGL